MDLISGGMDWAAQQMAEFLAVVTAYPDAAVAQRNAIERVGEAVEAEVVAIVREREVVACIGFPTGQVPVDEIVDVSREQRDVLEVGGLGSCRAISISLEEDSDASLVVARVGTGRFTPSEMNLMRGLARVLTLGLRTMRLVQSERELRERTEEQSIRLQERQDLFERLTKIQRSISHRAAPQEVFDAITTGASDLLGEDDAIVGLRLIDQDDPAYLTLVSSCGIDDDVRVGSRKIQIGDGAGGRAFHEKALVIIDDYASSPGAIAEYRGSVQAAMAAPVHEQGKVVGSLVFASRPPERRFSSTEQEILLAFAEHASLALGDAKSAAAQDRSYHESLSDISSKAAVEKKALEEQLRQAQKMEAVGRLAGGIAHDFNNLLMVMQTSAFFLKESLADGPGSEDVVEIMDASERATRLVRQLLTFSRKEVAQRTTLDLNEHVSEMDDLLRRSIGTNIELQVELADHPCLISGDPAHLDQILMNLAINGRDAMESGGALSIRTSFRCVTRDAPHGVLAFGDYVSLRVADTGCGMPDDLIDKIFEPFFTTKSKGQGTGLGLATVYGIVSGMGGHIEVTSMPGKGTTFTVLLPIAETTTGSDRTATGAPATSEEINQRVLVVDDDGQVGLMVKKMLVDSGFAVVIAGSGEEALAAIGEQERFDAVLSDLSMPVMSGIELARKIRERIPDQQVFLMSGYADERITHLSFGDEVTGFIQKPFKKADLLALLGRTMVGHRA